MAHGDDDRGDDMTIQAGGLLAMIRARYQPTEWAVLDELHDGTGSTATRRFDAVAFNCWPSRGMIRLGFEIKVSRADFTKELAAHEKRAALEQHCHEVYFVVGPDVCKPREIPEPWGLLEVRGDKLHCTHKAPHRKVGAVAETLAVCAIRRLTEANAAQAGRHYLFEGEQVTQEDMDARVDNAIKGAREMVERIRQDFAAQHAVFSADRLAFARDAGQWWRVWRDLEGAAQGRRSRGFDPPKCDPPTQDQIDDAIARLRMRGSAELESRLRGAQESIEAALKALAPVPGPDGALDG
jgi:hypothetical protein